MFEQHAEISVVIPIFNEEMIIPELFNRLTAALKTTGKSYELIFVDDGSTDNSVSILRNLNAQHKKVVKVLRLSRNFGHQLALTAGLQHAKSKAVIVMDGDLQDPPEVIPQFVDKWQGGFDIVYGVRIERKGETFFKKITAKIFYKLIGVMTSFEIPENVGDFYLLDKKVVDILNRMEERHRFIRGLVAWTGFNRFGVNYSRDARFAGKTKYTFWKMVKFSFDAATSFSFTPLRFISWVGAFMSFFSFLLILMTLYLKFFTNKTIVGWSSLMDAILFIGGIQLLAIGIIGEYLARIGDDVKHRPLYAVSEYLD